MRRPRQLTQPAQSEQVRFETVELFAQGMAPQQAARRWGTSRKSACAWHARCRDGGVEALRSKDPSARPSRMQLC
ncbi:helix-turn-helix domain-containing protein [Streptomyces sp. NPDC090442]|uniref:helix-turn-helix domain-containing protein n=1 Tax=Streptomyces sp. NPDC090442 TaxID=3365962 RepID=UPI0038184E52